MVAGGYGRVALRDGRAVGASVLWTRLLAAFSAHHHTLKIPKTQQRHHVSSYADEGGSHTAVPDAVVQGEGNKQHVPQRSLLQTHVRPACSTKASSYTPRRLTSSFDDEARPSCPHPFFATPFRVLRFPRHEPPPLLPPPAVAAAAADVEAAAVDPPRQHKAARVKPLFSHSSGAPSLWPWGGV